MPLQYFALDSTATGCAEALAALAAATASKLSYTPTQLARNAAHDPDIKIVCANVTEAELAGWLRPRLTSVAIPYADLGARAVEMLLDSGEQGPSVVRVPMPVARGTSVLRAL